IYFREVVVSGRQPENWDRVNSGFSRLISKFDRGKCLQQRKQRSAVEANLLSGNRCKRARAKTRNVLQCPLGSSPGPILSIQNSGNVLAAQRIILNARTFFVDPFFEVGRTRKRSLYRR